MSLLEVEGLSARHGLLNAVREMSFSVADQQVVAIVGANGAGKTTLLRTIAGAHPAAGGTITFDGLDITRMPAHRRVREGIALVPEGRRLFSELTVEENLRVAGRRARPGPWNVGSVLDAFPMLTPLRDRRAANLSGGQQQVTAIARALMTNPRLLIVDEVSLGLSPTAVDTVYAGLGRLRDAGATLILVEQDLRRALSFAGHVLCVLEGRVVLAVPAGDLTREQVTEAYFGLQSSEPR
ncbi:ABC transporter ATP-binding protein [Actinoplanes regularis]|uniref:Amino acid/amide ABC transporter ATP-binding protein 2, HAAT family n=1 Tax=Actinoplanes regularis TaxID=52697 RepID=A0A238VZQ9_9ACTN|nr:ABC transporter ATP-binding protein [Actinoplanes regularis]GIE91957.1 ABC transporter ATP-binding protein [Actinoplanes regularis]SNR39718.1 amino acid/amide ABC transporter ATP-binding protein 2, HAAT family [Actinoplanes regularis]